MKPKLSVLMCLSLATVLACTKEGPAPEPQPAGDTAAYNVIFLGTPGGNDQITLLDFAVLIYDRENGRIGDNVKFHGWMKPSKEIQPKLSGTGLDGIFHFDLGSRRGMSEEEKMVLQKVASRLSSMQPVSADSLALAYAAIFSMMDVEKEADAIYELNSASNISALLKKGADKYKAENYELMLFGHGTGFQAGYESPVRGCLPDDNFEDDHEITLPNIISGVELSGVKLHTVFTQCCLMGTLEDLAAFSGIAAYAIASTEVTSGGYFPEWLAQLSEKGRGTENFRTASRNTVDFYADSCFIQKSDYCATSQGFHDLSVMPSLLSAAGDIASWYADNYEKDTVFFNDVLMHSETVSEMYPTYSARKSRAQAVYFGTLPKDSLDRSSWEEVYDYLIMENNHSNIEQGFVFAHLVDYTLAWKDSCGAAGIDFSALKTGYDSYMSLLHRMSYIRCNKMNGISCSKDYLEYVLCSASVNVYALNESKFKALQCSGSDTQKEELWEDWAAGRTVKVQSAVKGILDGCYLATSASGRKAYDLSTVKANYQATAFDRATGWSKFLEILTINPHAGINPDRPALSGYQPMQ